MGLDWTGFSSSPTITGHGHWCFRVGHLSKVTVHRGQVALRGGCKGCCPAGRRDLGTKKVTEFLIKQPKQSVALRKEEKWRRPALVGLTVTNSQGFWP